MNKRDSRIGRNTILGVSISVFAAGALLNLSNRSGENQRDLEGRVSSTPLIETIEKPNEHTSFEDLKIEDPLAYKKPAPIEKPNYKVSDFLGDSDEVLLARMVFGEARNCSEVERVAIAYTVINRANDGKIWNGETIREAILKPKQYSCFNENDVNRDKLMDPETYDPKSFGECLDVAKKVLSGEFEDPTNGATHYFNPKVSNPSWAKKLEKIGRIETSSGPGKHEFYREN